MVARAPRLLKLLTAFALAGTLAACAVYPDGGGHRYGGGGYYARPHAYAHGPSHGGWRGGDGGGYRHGGWRGHGGANCGWR